MPFATPMPLDGRVGLSIAGDENEDVIPSPAAGRGVSSASMRFICDAFAEPTNGPGMACGSGDAGAGHCPLRAAAASTKLRVWRCCAAFGFLRESRDELDDADGIEDTDDAEGKSGAIWGLAAGDFDGTRGGEGVRRVDAKKSPMSSKPELCFGVSSAWLDTLVGKRDEADDAREAGLRAVADEGDAWKSAKSSSSKVKLLVGTAEAARA